MSEFSDAFSEVWDTSTRVFGDTIVIGDDPTEYNCVIHSLDFSDEVVPGRPGRTAILRGEVVVKAADWAAAGGAKGVQVTVGGASGRVLNHPQVGFTSDTVILVLGPRT